MPSKEVSSNRIIEWYDRASDELGGEYILPKKITNRQIRKVLEVNNDDDLYQGGCWPLSRTQVEDLTQSCNIPIDMERYEYFFNIERSSYWVARMIKKRRS